MVGSITSTRQVRGSVVRGVIHRLLAPKTSKFMARFLYKYKDSLKPQQLTADAEEKVVKIYFPTIKLIKKIGFIKGMREIDQEMTKRGGSISRSFSTSLWRLSPYIVGYLFCNFLVNLGYSATGGTLLVSSYLIGRTFAFSKEEHYINSLFDMVELIPSSNP